MKLKNINPILYFAWQVARKQYPEWDAPLTPKEGISEEEKNENIDYSESIIYRMKLKNKLDCLNEDFYLSK